MAIQKSKRLQPLHPGEVLKELLTDAGLTVNALALALRVPANRIGGIVKGQRGITDRKSTRLNSSHLGISYAVFCLERTPPHPTPTLVPYTTLFRSIDGHRAGARPASARKPNRGNRQRAAGHYGRHISTIGPLFWNIRSDVDEPAGEV